MRRTAWCLVLVAVALALPAAAQDAETAQRLLRQVLSQSSLYWPDGRVPPSRAALFRDQLEPARRTLEQLSELGERAIPALAELLRAPQAHARANAAYGLSRVGGPKTAPVLINAADDRHPGVRYQVTLALGYTSSAQALAALNKLAGDKEGAVRSAAIQTGAVLREILAAEQSETAEAKYAALVKLTANDNACAHLIRYGGEAVPALLQGLDSPDGGVVTGSAWCLAQIGDPRGLEPLWTRFTASLTKVPQTMFAQALADYRNAGVWPYLVKLLETAEADVAPAAQYYALERMKTLDHADRLKTIHAFLQRMMAKGTHKEVVRGPETEISPVAAACDVLEQVGDKTSLPLLNKIIDEAPAPAKSIVKPMAEQAKAAIEKRGT